MKKIAASEAATPAVPPLLLRQVDVGEAAGSALKLLFCSYDPELWNEGCGVRLFELVDVAAGNHSPPVGAALTVDLGPVTVELHRFAVNPAFPGRPVTGRLIAGIADRLRAAGAKSLLVATPTQVDEIGELWSAGFRKAVAEGEWLELSL